MSWRGIALIAALYGLLAVVLAALGAHLLPTDKPDVQKLWATALQIHMFHAVSLERSPDGHGCIVIFRQPLFARSRS